MQTNFLFVIDDFEVLEEVLIDACSIIYMHKAGFLSTLALELRLSTIDEVISEIGIEVPYIHVRMSPEEYGSTDTKLLSLAVIERLPIISEDKGVLIAAQQHGLSYYNALMALNFLYYREAISEEEYEYYVHQLKSIARYSDFVYTYAEIFFDYIKLHCKQIR